MQQRQLQRSQGEAVDGTSAHLMPLCIVNTQFKENWNVATPACLLFSVLSYRKKSFNEASVEKNDEGGRVDKCSPSTFFQSWLLLPCNYKQVRFLGLRGRSTLLYRQHCLQHGPVGMTYLDEWSVV